MAVQLVPAEGAFLDQILTASYDLWNDGLSRQAYGRWWDAQLGTPWGRARLRRVALADDGRVLASAKLYRFDATLDGRAVRVVGIGAVFTQPEARGRGHASALIARILDESATDTDLALLFSEIGAEYYGRLGFTEIPTTESLLDVAEARSGGAPAILVRSGVTQDLPAIAAMGQARAAGARFFLHRNAELIDYAIAKKRLQAGLGPPGLRETQFFVAEEGASAVAYVVISVHHRNASAGGSIWTLEECGDRDPAGARVGAILETLFARQPSEPRPHLRARLPRGFLPPQLSISQTRPTRDVMMIKPLRDSARTALTLTEADVLYWPSDIF